MEKNIFWLENDQLKEIASSFIVFTTDYYSIFYR